MSEQQTDPQPNETPDETPAETPAETPPLPDADEDADESEDIEGRPGGPAAGEPGEDEQQSAPGPGALSEKDIELRNQRLDKEAQRHANRVGEIVGEDKVMLIPCELCLPLVPGFRFHTIPDEQRAQAMLALGMSDVGNYAADTHTEACPECRGWGVVATGSKVSGQEALPCMNCGGRGWVGDRGAIAALAPAPLAAVETANGPPDVVPPSPEVAEAARAARAAGLIVIDPHAPATS